MNKKILVVCLFLSIFLLSFVSSATQCLKDDASVLCLQSASKTYGNWDKNKQECFDECSGCCSWHVIGGWKCNPYKSVGAGCVLESGRLSYCDSSHKCSFKKVEGLSCSSDYECISNNCVNGKCCSALAGKSCGGVGLCQVINSGVRDCSGSCVDVKNKPNYESALGTDRSAGYCLNGAWKAKKIVGTTCSDSRECLSGICSGNKCVSRFDRDGDDDEGTIIEEIGEGGTIIEEIEEINLCEICSSGYCSDDGEWKLKKIIGDSCIDSIECLSGICSENECVSVSSEEGDDNIIEEIGEGENEVIEKIGKEDERGCSDFGYFLCPVFLGAPNGEVCGRDRGLRKCVTVGDMSVNTGDDSTTDGDDSTTDGDDSTTDGDDSTTDGDDSGLDYPPSFPSSTTHPSEVEVDSDYKFSVIISVINPDTNSRLKVINDKTKDVIYNKRFSSGVNTEVDLSLSSGFYTVEYSKGFVSRLIDFFGGSMSYKKASKSFSINPEFYNLPLSLQEFYITCGLDENYEAYSEIYKYPYCGIGPHSYSDEFNLGGYPVCECGDDILYGYSFRSTPYCCHGIIGLEGTSSIPCDEIDKGGIDGRYNMWACNPNTIELDSGMFVKDAVVIKYQDGSIGRLYYRVNSDGERNLNWDKDVLNKCPTSSFMNTYTYNFKPTANVATLKSCDDNKINAYFGEDCSGWTLSNQISGHNVDFNINNKLFSKAIFRLKYWD